MYVGSIPAPASIYCLTKFLLNQQDRRNRAEIRCVAIRPLAGVSHLHYSADMKTSTLPAVRVEPALRSDAEAVLDEGESLSDFVASCVRDGVTWRRTQDAFLARARDAVERSERENNGISPQEVLRRIDDRLDAARQRLAVGRRRTGQ